jgi:hypothetical protein
MSTQLEAARSDNVTAGTEAEAEAPLVSRARWAAARMLFVGYVGFALFSGVGGILTAPIATWYFFGDWRFWRHWRPALRLIGQGWRMLALMVRGESGFMLDVPLKAPPHSAPVRARVELTPAWTHGGSCGPCSRCCDVIRCPVLDRETGHCAGYNAFFWRYFNCGRFPSRQREIDYYGCPKWVMREPIPVPVPVYRPIPVEVSAPET